MQLVGVDVGGTNIGFGVVDDANHVSHRAKAATPTAGPAAVANAIVELIESSGVCPDAIGVGIPGAVHNGEVVHAPNLQGWDDGVDFVKVLRHHLSAPVALGNDANLGLLGEWLAGVARGHDDVLGVWVGTGIGGGLILNGRLYTGSFGAAGELGHTIIRADGELCTCGRRGCVEAYAGRRKMVATMKAMVEAGRTTSLFDIQHDQGKHRPTSKVWKRALDEGDQLATELFDAAVESIAIGVASAVNLLDIEQVVVGGGMAERLGQDFADRIRSTATKWMIHPNPDLRFDVAALGDDSGVVGAASIARAALVAR